MKWMLLITLVISVQANAYLSEDLLSKKSDLITIPEIEEENIQANAWSPYLMDKCEIYNRQNANEDELRDAGLRRCIDGSVSFKQPKATGINGYEGKCGQTSASNTLFHICKRAFSPKDEIEKYLKDITPGVLPKTLRRGMKNIFTDNKQFCPTSMWKKLSAKSSSKFIGEVKQAIFPRYSHPNLLVITRNGRRLLRNPIMALIQNPGGKYLHWVTIIDIESNRNECNFIVNHWDNQYRVSCKKFASWSGKVGKTYPVVLKSYSIVSLH